MAQLSITSQNEDGDRVTRTFHIEDEHADDEAEQLEALAAQAEEVPDLRDQLSQAEDELEAVRDLAIGEIVRRKKLSGEVGEDADFSEDDEVEYLEGLPADRLTKEWERAMELDVDTSSATDPSANPPTNGEGEGVYDELAVEA